MNMYCSARHGHGLQLELKYKELIVVYMMGCLCLDKPPKQVVSDTSRGIVTSISQQWQ